MSVRPNPLRSIPSPLPYSVTKKNDRYLDPTVTAKPGEGEGTCRFARSFPFPFLSHLFLHTRREKRGPLFCLGWAGSKLHLLMLPEDRLHLSQVFPFPLPRFSIKGGHTVVSSDSLRGIYIGKRTSSRYYWVQARGAKQGREAPDR